MDLIDYVLLAGIALAVFFALRHMQKKRKSGCSGCCAECVRTCGPAREKTDKK